MENLFQYFILSNTTQYFVSLILSKSYSYACLNIFKKLSLKTATRKTMLNVPSPPILHFDLDLIFTSFFWLSKILCYKETTKQGEGCLLPPSTAVRTKQAM